MMCRSRRSQILIRRREFLPLLGMALAAPSILRAGAAPRLAAIDWAMLETAVAIGNTPVAACELIRFRADAVEPDLPDDTTDLGLRGTPNFELLQLVQPDLILSSPYYPRHLPRLEAIASVLSLPFYIPGEPPLPKALAALAAMGEAIGHEAGARRMQDRAESAFDAARLRLARFADRPTYLASMGDARHFRAFGGDSMFGNVLDRLGLANAWLDATQFSFAAPVPIEALARVPEARIVIVGPAPVQTAQDLRRSVLWSHLPAVAEGRLYHTASINPYGGIVAALRFAAQLERVLA